MPQTESIHLPELQVVLDDLRYQYGGPSVPSETPHVFIYFLTIRNQGTRSVDLLGRKWVIRSADGETLVVEGDKIVGQEPHLEPGQSFSYNSFHISAGPATASGSFHGVDADGNRVHCIIPQFELLPPN